MAKQYLCKTCERPVTKTASAGSLGKWRCDKCGKTKVKVKN